MDISAAFLRNKNVLVTGGTGFVGAHLVEKLVKNGAHVISTYLTIRPDSYFKTQNLDQKTTLTHVDVNHFEQIFDVITKFNVEYIFHLAAQPLVDVAYANPKQTLYSNILGTINILESARLFPHVRAVIVASSDKAYGKLSKDQYVEDDALAGDHPYEVSKSAADLISHSYFKTYKVPVVTTRFGNIYGEGDLNYSRIIPGVLTSIINNETLELRSNGKFVRDYLYVKDVVEGYILLASKINKVRGEAFNFGSSEKLSVLALMQKVEKLLSMKIKYKILDTAKNEIPYQHLDSTKVESVGWKQQHTIHSTISQIYEWYREIL